MTTVTRVEVLARLRARCLTGEALAIRERHRVSLQEMADDIGCAASAISRWERGLSKPTGPAAARYADALARLAALDDTALDDATRR